MRRILLLLAVVSGLNTSCDGIFSVEGRVVDEVGAPVPGARVSVYSGRRVAVRSDERGCFRLVKMTTWSTHEAPFLVEAQGHQTYRGSFVAPSGQWVVVRLPRGGDAQRASMEKLTADPACRDPNLDAAP